MHALLFPDRPASLKTGWGQGDKHQRPRVTPQPLSQPRNSSATPGRELHAWLQALSLRAQETRVWAGVGASPLQCPPASQPPLGGFSGSGRPRATPAAHSFLMSQQQPGASGICSVTHRESRAPGQPQPSSFAAAPPPRRPPGRWRAPARPPAPGLSFASPPRPAGLQADIRRWPPGHPLSQQFPKRSSPLPGPGDRAASRGGAARSAAAARGGGRRWVGTSGPFTRSHEGEGGGRGRRAGHRHPAGQLGAEEARRPQPRAAARAGWRGWTRPEGGRRGKAGPLLGKAPGQVSRSRKCASLETSLRLRGPTRGRTFVAETWPTTL